MTDPPDSPAFGRPYLASVALERNRWKKPPERVPSLTLSHWSERLQAAGFAGWELWEPHYFLAGPAERRALEQSPVPIGIFNTYLRPGLDSLDDWERVVEAVDRLGGQVCGIKFNLGPPLIPLEQQAEAALEWAQRLPSAVRMLCECHGGTVLEQPATAGAVFNGWPEDRFAAILHPLHADPEHLDRWFSALRGRIAHLHWQARDGEHRFCSLSAQRPLLIRTLGGLAAAGFCGTQSIEFVKGTGRPGESAEGLFDSAAADLQTLLRAQCG